MVQLTGSIWLLAAFATVALGQVGPPSSTLTSCLPGMPSAVCSRLGLTTASSTTTSSPTSTSNADSTTDTGSQTTDSSSSGATAGSNGSGEGSTATSSAGPLMTQAKSASGSGMSSGEKIGVGVGVGVGVAAIAAIAAVFLIARRRRRNTYDSNSRTARAMAGGNAPTFVGAAAVGRSQSRSPSVYTPPDTPSNYSRQSEYGQEGEEPLDATNIAATQQSRSRTPPRLSINTPSTPEQESLMPEQKAYFEEGTRPPALETNRAVSPVSPASPSDSRPPSPLRDYEKW